MKAMKMGITILLFAFMATSAYSLPSSTNAGHSDLARMSAKIKHELSQKGDSRLSDAIDGIFGNLDQMQKSFSAADVSEDNPASNGTLHFYDPATGLGYLGMPFNAKDRAGEFYRSSITDYCVGQYENDNKSAKKAWDELGTAEHLLQDMTTPAHTRNLSHITGDSYEAYVARNWDHRSRL